MLTCPPTNLVWKVFFIIHIFDLAKILCQMLFLAQPCPFTRAWESTLIVVLHCTREKCLKYICGKTEAAVNEKQHLCHFQNFWPLLHVEQIIFQSGAVFQQFIGNPQETGSDCNRCSTVVDNYVQRYHEYVEKWHVQK